MKQQTYCQSHQGFAHQFIILNQGQAKLACGECIYQLQDNSNKVDFGQIISIQKALTSPDSLIQKLTSQEKFSNIFQNLANLTGDELKQELANVESSLRQLQVFIDQVIAKAKMQVDLIIETRVNIKNDLVQKIKYPQFVKLLEELGNSQQIGQIDIYQQIEQKLSQHLNEVNQGDTNGLNGYLDETISKYKKLLQEQLKNNFQMDNLKVQIDDCLQQYLNLFSKMSKSYMLGLLDTTKSTVVSEEQFLDLVKVITDKNPKMISQAKLLYQGTKDGFNSNSFWSKINTKSNLLMIFKTKKDVIFGGYSPCKWESHLNNYVEDPTNSSFIFSYKDQQIQLYPLKEQKKRFAIYCSQNCGPTFGSGFDLQIGPTFQSGLCKLGQTYNVELQGFNPNTFFGSPQPLIAECEIYELSG
ncbi:unnamed protein product (macronuclear) [Paramecium tetraurelia]|uniref:TLDc domain-containing protein n=1 Tax=Paramecium tetraurelia TaxID=5888 RepID=A0BY02_PARTE|nr:uncharacterized protein GSPATT00033272001 [Paramecium tetraurelia]CAK63419.1 unnamed protein product [Paramecium tetraurelia]|eukprot:XP_001430817.1 hypothetical protein (macronuclear) [Paramecium tetraurelia strain d4-2]